MLPSERDALIRRGLPLTEIVARRVRRRIGPAVELEELLAIARVKLVEIVEDFDPERGDFEGFCMTRLLWGTYDTLRAGKRAFIRARASALAASQRFGEQLREEAPPPSSVDGLPTEEQAQTKLAALLDGHAAAMALALSRAHNDVDAAPDPTEGPEERVARAEIAGGLREEVSSLPDRERALIERHYYGDERFEAIATDLGISKAWASRIHAAAITQLARRLRVRFGAPAAFGT